MHKLMFKIKGKNGPKKSLKYFTWKQVEQQTLQIYKALKNEKEKVTQGYFTISTELLACMLTSSLTLPSRYL